MTEMFDAIIAPDLEDEDLLGTDNMSCITPATVLSAPQNTFLTYIIL